MAPPLNTLGLVYRAENKFGEAESAYRRSLGILEKVYGSESMDVGNINFNIAAVMIDQGRQSQAMPYIRKAQEIYERLLGGNSVNDGIGALHGRRRLSRHERLHRCRGSVTALRRCSRSRWRH